MKRKSDYFLKSDSLFIKNLKLTWIRAWLNSLKILLIPSSKRKNRLLKQDAKQ